MTIEQIPGDDIYPDEGLDSLMDILGRVVDAEDVVRVPVDAGEPRFRIETKQGAVWAMRRQRRTRDQMAENTAIAQRERDRIDEWEGSVNASLARDVQWFDELLRDWQAGVIETELGAHPLHGPVDRKRSEKVRVKSTKLPDGTVTARVSNGRFEAADPERAVAFLTKIGREDLLKIEPKIAAGPLDDALDGDKPIVRVDKRGEVGVFLVRLTEQVLGNEEAERLYAALGAGMDAVTAVHAFSLDFGPLVRGEAVWLPLPQSFALRVTQQLGDQPRAELWVEIPGVRKVGVDTVTITVS